VKTFFISLFIMSGVSCAASASPKSHNNDEIIIGFYEEHEAFS
jgi:hypothetical protein